MPDISEQWEQSSVRLDVEGAVATVTLDRREVLNALSEEVLDGIIAAFTQLGDDAAIRVAILRGAGGKAFASGMDLNILRTYDPAAAQQHFDQLNSALRTIETCRVPVIAMVQGYAVGGGCELAAACDLRVAGSGARIGVPIGRFGHCADRENLQRLLRLISPAHLRAMIMTDTLFDAADAQRMGFFNWVVPDAQLEAFTRSLATTVSRKAPLGLQTFKRALAEVLAGTVTPIGTPEEDMITALWRTQDFQEGVGAFLERRPAAFTGQ